MALDAFVLHLPRATGRRANAERLLSVCHETGKIDRAEIWPAVDGTSLDGAVLSDILGRKLFQPTYPFALKPGEVGCFLSHRQIWQEMQGRDTDAALIIEDDAGLDPALFPTALDLGGRHAHDLGYIQLQTRRTIGPATLIETSGPCQLTVPRLGGLRTTAQIVSKAAAAHLLRLSDVIDRPVDTFVQSHWHTGLRPATLLPSGVSDIASQLDGSTIQAGRKSLLEKMSREVFRNRYRRAVNHLSARSAAPAEGGLPGE